MKIGNVFAREVLDSRGNPTVEAEVAGKGVLARAIAPSGASTGTHEAHELRDGGKRFLGKGVLNAVSNVNKIIAPGIRGMEAEAQGEIDARMMALDGTPNKSSLGANATVAVSMAAMKAAAMGQGKAVYQYLGGNSLPVPMLNILNGGKHAGNALAIQEFMIMPKWPKTFKASLQMASETYHALGTRLSKKYGPSARNVGDEGGFAPNLPDCFSAMEEISLAIEEAGYGNELKLGVDAAASSFYDQRSGKYLIDGKKLGAGALMDYYGEMIKKYGVLSIEDPFHEEDFAGFAAMTAKFGPRVQIVGDDLLVTNPERLKTAISKKSVNALLLKINQIGTVSESMEVARMCRKNGIRIVVSHRSGESEDSFIADFAVGIEAGQIKTGAPARGERTAKYNQLLRIEEDPEVSIARVF